ncbi:MAG: HipA domain-containing protein [Moraxellaceae bacterium]|nr:HipA domain-containing protein [Moraxellaceae bacterium]
MEDFASLCKYPQRNIIAVNYGQIWRIFYEFSGDALSDVQQLAKRLLVNILLANGDAHLKTGAYGIQINLTPRLLLAYDIVTPRVYINDERHIALQTWENQRPAYAVSYAHFQSWSENQEYHGAP